jgi:NADH-quinone oxidoreductase subunit A
MTPLAAYLLLFVAVGVGFILVHLLAGSLIRPARPDAEKDTIYECGEPTIGSAWIQFDLRYYVVALLFVVFDVEVAFFFPWAEVFGKANAVANARKPTTRAADYNDYAEKVMDLLGPKGTDRLSVQQQRHYEAMRNLTQAELDEALREQEKARARVEPGKAPTEEDQKILLYDGKLRQKLGRKTDSGETRTEWDDNRDKAQSLAMMALVEVLVFFGVLLVGFAYLWRRGDLQWVRSTAAEHPEEAKAESKAPELVGSK